MSYRYVKQSDNTVWHINELRSLYKNVSIPEGGDLSTLGYELLIETPRPNPDIGMKIEELDPVNNIQVWAQVPLDAAELFKHGSHLVQKYLDDGAVSQGYDDIVSACSYAGAPNAFQEESISFLVWRADVWVAAHNLFNEVLGGARSMPTDEDLISLLPVRV
jgi:hypothetical protein